MLVHWTLALVAFVVGLAVGNILAYGRSMKIKGHWAECINICNRLVNYCRLLEEKLGVEDDFPEGINKC